jgi:hypothetical protein
MRGMMMRTMVLFRALLKANCDSNHTKTIAMRQSFSNLAQLGHHVDQAMKKCSQ